MEQFIKSLTTSELKTACKSFYKKAQADETQVNMLSFNATFEELKLRLNKEQFEKFCINL